MSSAALSEELGLFQRHTVNLAERFRHLLMMARSSGANRDQLLATVMEDFASALEELHAAGAELQAQQEALTSLNASLSEQRSHFQHFFEMLSEAALVTTPAGVIQEANAAALALFRQTRARLIGRPLAAFVTRGHGHRFTAELDQAAAGPDGAVAQWQTTIRRYDGRLEELPVACRVAPVAGAHGQVNRLHWLIRPVDAAPDSIQPAAVSAPDFQAKHTGKDLIRPRHTG